MKSDYYLSLTVLLQMIAVTIQQLLPLYGIMNEEAASSYRIIFTFASYVPAIVMVAKRNIYSLLIPIAGYSIVLLLHYIFYEKSHVFIESRVAITLTPMAILTAVFIYNIKNFSNFQRVLLGVSRVVPLLGLLFVWGRQNLPVELASSYSMSFGYSMLLPAGYLFASIKWWDKVLSLVMFLLILIAGSRGPAVVLLLYYIVFLIMLAPHKRKIKTIFVLLLAGSVAIPLMVKYFDFSNSRTLSLVQSESALTHMSERDFIYEKAKEAIGQNPVFGQGIGADRAIWEGHCHNIFLELSLHYGIFVSVTLSLLFALSVLKYFFRPNQLINSGGRAFYVLMILYGFLPMLVSGSYLIDFAFAFMIGYLFRVPGSLNNYRV